ncbi:hypothetical protein [Gymnodinialimonas sp. 57CJ19]|uniref:hypothetical protein n=1 Tax=Gymnodinialimonas sp. 57CJ19 TaxID=3138498 RepID=UPI003134633C
MTDTLVLALIVIILPGVVALMWVTRSGVMPGLLILGAMVLWTAVSLSGALNPGNAPIAPEIFGGETIAHRQRTGLPEALWTFLVLVPGTIWTGVAVLIGRAAYRRNHKQDDPS